MCKSCNAGVSETPEHMILHCAFAKNVWPNIPVVSQLVSQDLDGEIKDWISKWLTTKNLQDKSATVLTTAWCIWKDRCSKVFDNKSLNPQFTARTALRIAEETVNSLASASASNASNTVSASESNFLNTIHHDSLLILCDASFDKYTNKSGVGIVAMNPTGDFKSCKLVSGRDACSEGAESVAILEVARWIKAKNFRNFFLISDAKNIMAYLNNCKGQTSWTSCSVLNDCLFLLKDIQHLRFKYLKRELNSAADLATKHGRIGNVTGQENGMNSIFPTFSKMT
ncbi:uncharacterized protein LOC113279885 [Papaver somniferum]|uniref:uncharacterized protein LOC113279885 n=1 Tax=Papaver somniferum TaxID=3469 RepID=UPI000E70528C|nr:uncharacterized protein LOC113279885 [Papaver somniferum]